MQLSIIEVTDAKDLYLQGESLSSRVWNIKG